MVRKVVLTAIIYMFFIVLTALFYIFRVVWTALFYTFCVVLTALFYKKNRNSQLLRYTDYFVDNVFPLICLVDLMFYFFYGNIPGCQLCLIYH